jgi:hypothetical protein
MFSVKSSAVSLAVVLLFSLGCASALFGGFSYGNLNGVNVVYQAVAESSTTDPTTQLFGSPGITDDSLLFSPVNFGIQAVGAGGNDYMNGTLTTTIRALNNNSIYKLRFAEAGDYTLAGSGTSATDASVTSTLLVRITEADNLGITPVVYSTNLAFNPSGGTYNLVEDPGMTKIWEGGVEVNLSAILANADVPGEATAVEVSLDNSLLAHSESGTIAFIKKKQVSGSSITAITIPEPSAWALFGMGVLSLLGYAGIGRRR